MARILFCGDPHGDPMPAIEAARAHRPDAVILLGDIQPARPLHEEYEAVLACADLLWILGNHDTDQDVWHDRIVDSKLADRNVHGPVVTVAGVRVAGLHGVFRGRIWNGDLDDLRSPKSPGAYTDTSGKANRWRGGFPLRHRSTVFPIDVAHLMQQKAHVLVTHEAPDLHAFGNAAITRLASAMGVHCAVHGHHHETVHYPGGLWHGVGMAETWLYDTDLPDGRQTFQVK